MAFPGFPARAVGPKSTSHQWALLAFLCLVHLPHYKRKHTQKSVFQETFATNFLFHEQSRPCIAAAMNISLPASHTMLMLCRSPDLGHTQPTANSFWPRKQLPTEPFTLLGQERKLKRSKCLLLQSVLQDERGEGKRPQQSNIIRTLLGR